MKKITLETLRGVVGQCKHDRCSRFVVDELTIEEKRGLVDMINAWRGVANVGDSAGYWYCAKHEAQILARHERMRRESALHEMRANSYPLAPNLLDFATPWQAAINNNPEAWTLAREWKIQHGNLFLWGREGVGKTALGRYLLLRALDRGYTIAEFSCTALSELSFQGNWRKHDAAYEKALHAGVLLLDDISAPVYNAQMLAKLWHLANERSKLRNVRTVITSNMNSRALFAQRLTKSDKENEAVATGLLRRFRPVKEMEMRGDSLRKQMEYEEKENGN